MRKKPKWEKAYLVVEPQISAEGIHTYTFNRSCPIELGFHIHAGRHNVRMNRHDYPEIIYVCEGRGDVRIQDRVFRVKRRDLLVIGPDLYHRIMCPPGTQLKLASLNFQSEMVRGSNPTADDEQYLMPFFSQSSSFPHVVHPSSGVPHRVLELIRGIHAELPATTSLARLAVKTYLKSILLLLARHYSRHLGTRETFEQKQRALQRLQPVFEHLETHFGDPIRVEDAARLCAMSTSHFMGFFKRHTGQSFVAYLNGFRISKAQPLLASTDKSISAISQEIGFCDQSSFGRVFRRLAGMTPWAYRQRFGNPSFGSKRSPSQTDIVLSRA